MEENHLNLSDPGVLEALCDDNAMHAWYLLRAAAEPLSASAVSSGLRLDSDLVHRALDLLEHARLVRKLPARGTRRAITYETTARELVVVIPNQHDGDTRCIELHDAIARRDREMVARTRRFRQSVKREWFFDQVSDFVPTREEVIELQRRVYEVSRYVLEIAGRVRSPAPGTDLGPRHVLQLRIAAIEGEMLPMPQIRMLTQRALAQHRTGRTAAPASLGAREREIALLLQSGLSRPQVAERLGISPQTVGTYCKRLFEKLAIRRATELGRFNFDHLPSKPKRRGRGSARA